VQKFSGKGFQWMNICSQNCIISMLNIVFTTNRNDVCRRHSGMSVMSYAKMYIY